MIKINKKQVNKIVLSLVLVITSIIMLYPLVYMVLGALSDREMYLESGLFPTPSLTAERITNFTIIFKAEGLFQSIFVTIVRIIFYSLVNIIMSTVGGYIFSKLEFKGKSIVFLYFMSSMMIPGVAIMVPSYILMARFPLVGGNDILGMGGQGFINNPAVLFVTGWVPVYNMFLLRQSFTSFGSEMKEAAHVDGAGHFKIMFEIYLPLALPAVAVMSIGLVIGHWNDYLNSLIYLPDMKQWHTVGTKIIEIMDRFGNEGFDIVPNYPRIYGISFMFMLVPIAIFLAFQRFFIDGLAMGAVKG